MQHCIRVRLFASHRMYTNYKYVQLSIFVALLSSFFCHTGVNADEAQFKKAVDQFTKKHCTKCHDQRKGKGDFRIDLLSRDLSDPANAIAWQDALDLVKIGEMPPEGQPRPAAKQLKNFVRAVEHEIRRCAEAASESHQIKLRRLSHSALDNTVRDLLGTRLKLSDDLPEDPEVSGFDNMAATLNQTSDFMRVLQHNARRIAEDVIVEGKDPRISIDQQASAMKAGRKTERIGKELVLWSSRNRTNIAWPAKFVAPRTGIYHITLTAAQTNNLYQLERTKKKYQLVRSDDKQQARLVRQKLPQERIRQVAIMAMTAPINDRGGGGSTGGRRVGIADVSTKLSKIEFDCELEAGESFFVYAVDCPRLQNAPWAKIDSKKKLVGERLRIRRIKIEGPTVDEWPNAISRQLITEDKQLSPKVLNLVLSRAFRQPVQPDLVKLYTKIFDVMRKRGHPPQAAARRVIEAVLCSPRFLYVPAPEGRRDIWAVASRISYFLWNSKPDDQLFRLAAKGGLWDPHVIEEQVRRMIADPKSDRFVKDFTGQWLGLRKVGAMLPDPKLYPYYDPALERSMRQESEALFANILKFNRPVSDFIDPGYAMLNERLAKHYGIKGVQGDNIRKVKLASTHPRGGLLGHASILTITSNGTRTSPVVRGVWVLENLLDSPPNPPPPDVEPIEPDVRGATTIREMLAKHRHIPTCNECHRRIDPWGFGLENFNAVGAWRDKYGRGKKGKPVDASGKTARGESFDGVVEMRKALLRQEDRFTHALASKLFAHAVGHSPTLQERVALEDIVKEHQQSRDGLADLIVKICTNKVFLEN